MLDENSRKDVEKQLRYSHEKIRKICAKDESLYIYLEDIYVLLGNCLNILAAGGYSTEIRELKMKNYKKILKKDVTMLEKKKERLLKKQEKIWEALKRLYENGKEEEYLGELKKLKRVNKQLDTTFFELEELRKELREI